MNEQEFTERAHANPLDDSPEFLEAAAASPDRQRLLDELKTFDAAIRSELLSVSAPEGLKQELLNIPEGSLHPDTAVAAANDSFWRRNFKYAAILILAVGVVAILSDGGSDPMEQVIFNHLYSELNFLDVESTVTIDDVNQIMNTRVGKEFLPSSDMESLEINVTQDCWIDIAKGVQGVHMVMKGNVGQVTVMVIPNTPIEEEMPISDDRFEGVITPTPGGNLVVLGEKDESIHEFSNLIAANINW